MFYLIIILLLFCTDFVFLISNSFIHCHNLFTIFIKSIPNITDLVLTSESELYFYAQKITNKFFSHTFKSVDLMNRNASLTVANEASDNGSPILHPVSRTSWTQITCVQQTMPTYGSNYATTYQQLSVLTLCDVGMCLVLSSS